MAENTVNCCFKCGGDHHLPHACPVFNKSCYSCGKFGHISKNCHKKRQYTNKLQRKQDFYYYRHNQNPEIVCLVCGDFDHITGDCAAKRRKQLLKKICYKCGILGHTSFNCINDCYQWPFRCFICGGKKRHSWRRCKMYRARLKRQIRNRILCNYCRNFGHFARQCKSKLSQQRYKIIKSYFKIQYWI